MKVNNVRVTQASIAVNTIREMIIQNRFASGEPLCEVDLARFMAMSRTPIREAITQLCHEGLLKMISGRGAIVPEMTRQDIEEILDLRMVLEPLAAKTSIYKIPNHRLLEAEEIWKQVKEQYENRVDVPVDDLIKWDVELHQLITDNCGNVRLKEFLEKLRLQTRRFVADAWLTQKTFAIDTVDQHLEILDGLKNRDYNFVKEKLEKHVMLNKNYRLLH